MSQVKILSNYLTATETIALVREGKLTIEQLAKDHLDRYKARNDDVLAWVNLDEKRVLEEARRLDNIPVDKRGPLHGAIIGIKDIMNMPTEEGSLAYKGNEPGVDATIVAIARHAGALIYGKTQTTEFANGFVGPETKNPYDPKRTPGGSSSGSAAGVRDYQCQIAFGTQTGGSLIRPASNCGVFGIKPTWGLISKEGLKTAVVMLDTVGFYARSLTDLEIILSIYNIFAESPCLPFIPSTPKPLNECRFLLVKTEAWDLITPSPELERAWMLSIKLLENAGATIEQQPLGAEFDGLTGPNGLIEPMINGEAAVNLLYEFQNKDHYSNINWQNQRASRNDSHTTSKQLIEAWDKFAALRLVFDDLASGYDAVITPSVPSQAPEGLAHTGNSVFNNIWSGLHVPVVHVPGFASENGMPIGLSLVAPRFEDERLLSVAKAVAGVWINTDLDKLNGLNVPAGVANLQV